ncbi:hypothetical protein [Rheinheimera aquimaris]|uniref:hypothetical protein n=1 Tax=Rheinheimera aquimaris TaxID=412437 RepID=UPI001E46063A|nr:hypothetical protein [Rheinheimera aquimaris]MCD1599588.1 hypothetical protein [Rheinheimera aquimaris]
MQMLKFDQVDKVSGAVGPAGAALGAVGTVASAYYNGARGWDLVSAGALGAASGFFGGWATSAGSAAMRIGGAGMSAGFGFVGGNIKSVEKTEVYK